MSCGHGGQADEGIIAERGETFQGHEASGPTAHSSCCSSRTATSRTMGRSLGKMDTTSMRRLTSRMGRSIPLVEWILVSCSFGKPCRRARPLRPPSRSGELAATSAQAIGDGVPLRRRLRSPSCEGSGDEGRNHTLAALVGVRDRVTHEMHPAALPAGVGTPLAPPP